MPAYLIAMGILHCAMVVVAAPENPGSLGFLIFLGASAFSLSVAAGISRSFFGVSVGAFLWLGLWLKFCAHLYFPRALVEPVGTFVASAEAYNEVMLVSGLAMAGAAGGLLASRRLGLFTIRPCSTGTGIRQKWSSIPVFVSGALWVAALALVAGVSWINADLGIMRVGLNATTILPWPGNAMISLFLTTGYFYLLALLMQHDYESGRRLYFGLLVICISVTAVSISLFSRGLVVFHLLGALLPLAAALSSNRRMIGPLAFGLVVAAAAFFSTIYFVQTGRDIAYLPEPQIGGSAPMGYDEFGVPIEQQSAVDKIITTISGLVVGRWVGLEGVMAVQAYEPKGLGLFLEHASERSVADQASKYQYIARSAYVTMNGKKFHFATVPGPAAFFFLSGALPLVSAGLFALVLAGSALEFGTFLMTRNVFAASFTGVNIASIVAQFGITPASMGPQIVAFVAGVLGLMAVKWIFDLRVSPRTSNLT
ncbi:MAG: hypothetical protein ACOH2T_29225 [Pseudomonas sp.]